MNVRSELVNVINVLIDVGRMSGIARKPSPIPINMELVVVALILAVCVVKFCAYDVEIEEKDRLKAIPVERNVDARDAEDM